ncbi:MAG: hypothetical protein ACYTKD_30370 [Planctomycetota bacterium]
MDWLKSNILVVSISLASILAGVGVLLYFVIRGVCEGAARAAAVFAGSVIATGLMADLLALTLMLALVLAAFAGVRWVGAQAAGKPYEWAFPVLSVASGLLIEVTKEVFVDAAITKVIFGGCILLLYVLGGIAWRMPGLATKIIAVALYLVGPGIVFGYAIRHNVKNGLGVAVSRVPYSVWVTLGLWILLAALVCAMGLVTRNTPK